MKTLKLSLTLTILFSLTGCWFIFIPIPLGPIVRAIQGPRYCVTASAVVGSRIMATDGKWVTVAKLHGEDRACFNPTYPVLANVKFDEDQR